MLKKQRSITIPGLGGPFIETTLSPDFDGGADIIRLERAPDFQADRTRLAGLAIVLTLLSFTLGLMTGLQLT